MKYRLTYFWYRRSRPSTPCDEIIDQPSDELAKDAARKFLARQSRGDRHYKAARFVRIDQEEKVTELPLE